MVNDHINLNELLFSFSKALDFVEAELLGIVTNHGKRAPENCAIFAEDRSTAPARPRETRCAPGGTAAHQHKEGAA